MVTLPKLTGEKLEFFSSFLEKIQFYAFWKAKCVRTLERQNVCVPYLKFSDLLYETHYLFYLVRYGIHNIWKLCSFRLLTYSMLVARFYYLLIIFANGLDPEQDRRKVRS